MASWLRRLWLVIALLVHSVPGAAGECGSIEAGKWILGEWRSRDGDKTFTESWVRLSDTTFEGQGITTRGDDPEPFDGESLRLVQMRDGVFYLSKVDHNDLPIAFKLTQCAAGRLVFENAAHGFPRRLEYVEVDEMQMSVRVSDGADKGFTLAFRRLRAQ